MPTAIINAMQGPFAGTLATMMLYGVICMQTFHYASNYGASDRHMLRWWVGCVWLLESIHTGFSVHFIEYYLLLHFNDPAALEYVVWTQEATYLSGFLVALSVELFFIWRIWQLSKQALICIPLAMLALSRTGVGIENATIGLRYTAVNEFLVKVFPTMIAGWVLCAATDTLIAISLCYYLRKQRSGMKRTDHIINTLLLYTINTGALTSIFSVIIIITYLTLPGLDFTAFVQVQSKLYAISFLASLNARKGTLESARAAVSTGANNLSLHFGTRSEGKFDPRLTPILEVRKDVEEETFPTMTGQPPYV